MRQDWQPLTLVTQVGLTIVVTLVISLLLGLWLDSLLHTGPLLTLVFSLVGIAAGTINVYRMVSRAIAESVAQRGPDYHPRPSREPEALDEDTDDEDDEVDRRAGQDDKLDVRSDVEHNELYRGVEGRAREARRGERDGQDEEDR